jgi:hypothetical protein
VEERIHHGARVRCGYQPHRLEHGSSRSEKAQRRYENIEAVREHESEENMGTESKAQERE